MNLIGEQLGFYKKSTYQAKEEQLFVSAWPGIKKKKSHPGGHKKKFFFVFFP